MSEGQYNVQAYCNDTAENIANSENRTIFIDTTSPSWTANVTSPASGINYSSGAEYQFNTTWNDNYFIDTVLIEHNFSGVLANYSMDNVTSVFNYTWNDLAAGSYLWRTYANDTATNDNFSDYNVYNVNKSQTDIALLLNGSFLDVSVEAGSYVNISAIQNGGESVIYLYQNGTEINSGSSLENIVLFNTPGSYLITTTYYDSQNYTSTNKSLVVSITDTVAPEITAITPLDNDILGWTVLLRANVTDTNLESVWYEIRNGTLTDATIDSGFMNNYQGDLFNGTLYTNKSWPYNTTNFNSTNLTLIIYANDTSGNVVNTTTSWTLDNSKPSIQYILPTQAGIWTSTNFNLNVFLANTKLNYTNFTIYNTTDTVQTNETSLSSATFSWTDLVDVDALAEGNYTILTYAQDYIGNNNSKETWFYVDKTSPNVTTINETGWVAPTLYNGTYTNNTELTFNFTCDESFVDDVWVVYNGVENFIPTVSSGGYLWTLSLSEGQYNVQAYCNDTAGNIANSENRTIFVDVTAPSWTANVTSPASGINYSSGAEYQFNTTWNDNNFLDTVLIEHNFSGVLANYSMDNVTSVFNYTWNDLAAGSYLWRTYANDTATNDNFSDYNVYNVEKTNLLVTLESHVGWEITNTTMTNISCYGNNDESNITLYRNDSLVASGIAETIWDNQTLDVGQYNYTCNASPTQNYTFSQTVNTLTVNLKNETVCNLTFIPFDTQVWPGNLSAYCACNNQEASAKLYRNGTDVTGEIGLNVSLAAANYLYTCNTSSTQNFTLGINESTYTIQKASTSLNLTLNNTKANMTRYVGATINITGELLVPDTGYVEILQNGVIINSGTSNLTNYTQYNSAGEYNITFVYPETQNYSYASENYWIIIQSLSTPSFNYSELEPQPNGQYNQTQNVSIFVSVDTNSSVNATIYYPNGSTVVVPLNYNGTEWYYYNNFTDTLQPGNYNITLNALDNDTASLNTTTTNFTTYDVTAPAVNITSPSDGSTYNQAQNVSIVVNVTDYYYDSVGIVYANITLPDGSTEIVTLVEDGDSQNFVANFTSTTLIGTYNVTIWANDTSNNLNNTEYEFFIIQDVTNPVFNDSETAPLADTQYNQTQNATLFVGLDDNSTVIATVFYPNGSSEDVTLVYNGTQWYYGNNFTNTFPPGNYNVTINATDVSGNSNLVFTNFTINDVTAPAVNITSPSDGSTYNQSQNVNIVANVTDYYYDSVGVVYANITLPNGGTQIVTLTEDGNSQNFIANFTNTSTIGTYTVTIWANDTSNNLNNSEYVFIVSQDVTYPIFNDSETLPTADTQYNQTQNAILFVGLDDNSTVIATVFYPNGSSEDVTLVYNGTQWYYENNFTNTFPLGNYNVTINATDISGNSYLTFTNFTINDVTAPAVNIISPSDGSTYNQSQNVSIVVNVTDYYYDSVGVVYANITLPNGGTQIVTLVEDGNSQNFIANFTNTSVIGTYTVTIWANDTSNNLNNTQYVFFIAQDVIAPLWTENVTSPASGTNYSSGAQYQFNTTWTDNNFLDYVLIEHNFSGTLANYSMDNVTSVFNYTWYDLAAGSYLWRTYANDTGSNDNFSDYNTYNVEKRNLVVNLESNNGWNIQNNTLANISCYANSNESNITLYRNDTLVASGIAETVWDNQTFLSGHYGYTCNASPTQNFTFSQAVNTLIVAAKNTSECNLTFLPIGSQTWPGNVSANCVCNNQEASATLYRNGTDISGLIGLNETLAAGVHNYVCNVSSTENFTTARDESNYTILRAQSILNLTLDNNNANITVEAGQFVNITGELVVPGSGDIEIYQEGSLIYSGTSNFTSTRQFNVSGAYNISLTYPQTQNYTYSISNYWINVQDNNAPNISITTPLENDIVGWTILLRANVSDYDLSQAWYEIRNGSLSGDIIETNFMNNISLGRFNGSLRTNRSWPYNSSNYNSTNLTLVVYANDTNNNIANATTTFILDNSQPSIQYVTPSQSGLFTNSDFALSIWLSNTMLNFSNYTIYNTTETVYTNSTNLSSATFMWTDNIDVSSLNEGNYSIETYAVDYVGNNRTKTTWFYVDKTAPTLLSTNAINATNSSIVIEANINVEGDLSIQYGTDLSLGSSVTNTSLATNLSEVILGLAQNTTYYYNITTCDSLGNCQTNGTYNFTTLATDDVPPVFINTTGYPYSHMVLVGTTMNLTSNATDDVAIDSIWINVTYPNGSIITLDNPYNFTAPVEGLYNYTFIANDTSGNWVSYSRAFVAGNTLVNQQYNLVNATGGISGNVNVYFTNGSVYVHEHDFVAFHADQHIADFLLDYEYIPTNGIAKVMLRGINISVDTNETLGYQNVIPAESGYLSTIGINVTYESWQIAELTYNYSTIGYSNENNLHVYKCANWSFSNSTCLGTWNEITTNITQNTDTDVFVITTNSFSGFAIKEITPVTAPSGGGGGGSSSACTYDWQCSEWNDCSIDGESTRTCSNLGTCGGIVGKPEETKSCEYVKPFVPTPTEPVAPEVEPEVEPAAKPSFGDIIDRQGTQFVWNGSDWNRIIEPITQEPARINYGDVLYKLLCWIILFVLVVIFTLIMWMRWHTLRIISLIGVPLVIALYAGCCIATLLTFELIILIMATWHKRFRKLLVAKTLVVLGLPLVFALLHSCALGWLVFLLELSLMWFGKVSRRRTKKPVYHITKAATKDKTRITVMHKSLLKRLIAFFEFRKSKLIFRSVTSKAKRRMNYVLHSLAEFEHNKWLRIKRKWKDSVRHVEEYMYNIEYRITHFVLTVLKTMNYYRPDKVLVRILKGMYKLIRKVVLKVMLIIITPFVWIESAFKKTKRPVHQMIFVEGVDRDKILKEEAFKYKVENALYLTFVYPFKIVRNIFRSMGRSKKIRFTYESGKNKQAPIQKKQNLGLIRENGSKPNVELQVYKEMKEHIDRKENIENEIKIVNTNMENELWTPREKKDLQNIKKDLGVKKAKINNRLRDNLGILKRYKLNFNNFFKVFGSKKRKKEKIINEMKELYKNN